MGKVRLGHRIVRTLFVSGAVALLVFLGFHVGCVAVNTIAGTTVLDPVGIPLLASTAVGFAGFGIEWSKDIEEQEKEK